MTPNEQKEAAKQFVECWQNAEDISLTIFGAVFESALNPETCRSGGMHYTSIENIHKLTGPLFYDELKDELAAIEGAATEKERKFKLSAFRQKIASLKFLEIKTPYLIQINNYPLRGVA